ncbi:hypothetical protein [Rhizobium rhizogenes]|uniref:hypothetical protein n=1 Tax=Rhizobium rhizogenes TaxID=359 RepID=UPI0022BD1DED|nr:hypothetical protein [Rhizobium rhizogenes]MCZ7464119.1 hypothetical protein [Rhizobium rhizogenes]
MEEKAAQSAPISASAVPIIATPSIRVGPDAASKTRLGDKVIKTPMKLVSTADQR